MIVGYFTANKKIKLNTEKSKKLRLQKFNFNKSASNVTTKNNFQPFSVCDLSVSCLFLYFHHAVITFPFFSVNSEK